MTWLGLGDGCLLVFAFLFPIYSVLKWKRSGIFWGTIANWASLVIAGISISYLDAHSRGAFSAFFDVVWFLVGWVVGLTYCYFLVLIRELLRSSRENGNPGQP